jgi:hypothetical protein
MQVPAGLMAAPGRTVDASRGFAAALASQHLLDVLGKQGDQTVFSGVEQEGAHLVGHGLHVKGLPVSQPLSFEFGRGFDAALLGEVGVVRRNLATKQEHGIIKVAALVGWLLTVY